MALEVQQSAANVERVEKTIFFRIGKVSNVHIGDLYLCMYCTVLFESLYSRHTCMRVGPIQ